MSPTLVAAVTVPAFFACLLCIPPLILQVQARNTPVYVLIASVLTINLLHFINALIWRTEDPTYWWKGQGLCDVEAKLRLGLDMTAAGGITCVFRQLSLIVAPDMDSLTPSRAQGRNTIIFETVFCGILPLLRMILSYVVQPDRYRVYGVYGCSPTVDTSWPSYALVLIWPPAVCLVACVYCALATSRMAKHAQQMSKLLPGGQIRANRRKVIKLYLMALVVLVVMVSSAVTQALALSRNILPFLQPYSWSRIHPSDWARRIETARFTKPFILIYAVSVTYAIIVFVCFGIGPEPVAVYSIWLDRLRSRLWWSNTTRQLSRMTNIYSDMWHNPRHRRNSTNELEAM